MIMPKIRKSAFVFFTCWILLFVAANTWATSISGKLGLAPARPNIVVFISDDHGYEDSEVYGNKVVRTPVLNKLAAEGMKFTHAFAATATCVPSRSVLYSGLMPARNGAHPNHSKVRPDLKTLPHYLKALGYRVILAGKTHIDPYSAFPFEYVPMFDNPQKKSFVEVMHDLNQKSLDSLITTLGKQVNQPPFCLVVASYAPHVKWPVAHGYTADKMRLPPYLVNTPETRLAMAQYYTEISNDMEETLQTTLTALQKSKLAESSVFIYTTDQGPQFPFAKWNLYDAGIRTPFIVRWPGVIPKNTTSQALISHVDLTPTLIELAGGQVPDGLDGHSYLPVLLKQKSTHRETIYATHTADAKFGKFNYYPTRALRNQKYKYILNLVPQETYTTHITKALDGSPWPSWLELAKTDKQAAFLVNKYQHRPAEELYDLEKDPYELNNLAANSASQELLQTYRKDILNWMEQQNDQEGLTLFYNNIKFSKN